MLEFLIIGVLWQLYSDDAIKLSKLPQKILNELNDLRQKGKDIKGKIDIIRGILSTIFLMPNDNYNSNAALTYENFNKLISWLKASGEFNEEVKRFLNWGQYICYIGEEKTKEFFTIAVTLALYFSARSEAVLGKYTVKIDEFLKNEYPKHKWKEDVILCGRQRVEYHLNMVGAEILNCVFSGDFLKTKEKKLILPACMRYKGQNECKAKATDEGYVCRYCSNLCRVNKLTKLGNQYGFQVLIIPHASSAFKNANIEYGKIGIVGVACILNLLEGGYKARRLNMVPQCVILDYCGCKNHWDDKGIVTDVNLNQLKKVFNICL
ncbi:DUF116 domain-containing protein [Clostridium sp. DMHC 10]|nr:DUF116 domain-containing protein [Clostridium sp. DMHC 10]